MRYITVAKFREQAETKQVFGLSIHACNGCYGVVLRLRWRNEEHLLVSHHEGKAREWTSLDRLLAFMAREGVEVPDLVVKFIKE